MAEISEAEVRALINALNGNTNAVKKNGSNSPSRKSAASSLRRELSSGGRLDRGLNGLNDSIKVLTGTTEQFSHGLRRMLEGFVGAQVIGSMISSAENVSQTYREMTDIGQTFSGSMIEMAKQAAESQLSLDEYSKMMMKNSTVSAIMNRNLSATNLGLGGLQKGVRNGLKEFGLYGMTIEQISQLTSDYSETLRLQNSQEILNTDQTKRSIMTFTDEVTKFADFSGKSRKEIIAITQSALRDTAVTSRMMIDGTDIQRKALEKATAFFAAIPGEAGQVFSTFLAQSFGNRSAIWTDAGKTFIDAGMGSMIGVIDELKNKIEAGTADIGDFKKTGKRIQEMDKTYRQTLQLQAMAGNAAAKQVLSLLDQFHGLNFEDLGKQVKRQQGLTKFFSLFETAHRQLSGAFLDGFLSSISSIEQAFDGLSKSGTLDVLSKDLKIFGSSLGTFIAKLFTQDNVNKLDQGVRWLTDKLLKFGTFFVKWIDDLTIGTKQQKGIFHDFKDGIMNIANFIDWVFKVINDNKDAIVSGFNYLKDAIVGLVNVFKAQHEFLTSVFGEKAATAIEGLELFMLIWKKGSVFKIIAGLAGLYEILAKFVSPSVATGVTAFAAAMTAMSVLPGAGLVGKGLIKGGLSLGSMLLPSVVEMGGAALAFLGSAAALPALLTVAAAVLTGLGLAWLINWFNGGKQGSVDAAVTDWMRRQLGLSPLDRSKDNAPTAPVTKDGYTYVPFTPQWDNPSSSNLTPNIPNEPMSIPSLDSITPFSSPESIVMPPPTPVKPTSPSGSNAATQHLSNIENLMRQHVVIMSSLMKENNALVKQGNYGQRRLQESLA